jgi:hypothetical protein
LRDELTFGTNWLRFPFNAERQTSPATFGKAAEPSVGTNIVAHLRTHGDFLVARRSILKREALRAVGMLTGGLLYTVVITVLALSLAALLLLGGGARVVVRRDEVEGPGGSVSREQVRGATDTRRHRVAHHTHRYRRNGARADRSRVLDNVTHRLGLIWTDMLDDITAQEIGAAFGAGFLASLVALVIFVAGIKVWKGAATAQPGESREDAYEVRLLRVAALLVWVAVFIVPYVNATVAATSWPWASCVAAAAVLRGGRRVCVGISGLRLCYRALRDGWTPLVAHRAVACGAATCAICLYALIVHGAVRRAALPRRTPAHAVGVAGVLAPSAR